MIATITGMIQRKRATDLIVDVGNIGYQVLISLSTHNQVGETGERVQLFTRLYMREDNLQLFGFYTESERELFNLFITVSGIGPRLAITILSGMGPQELIRALTQGDETAFLKIKGVGKKTAKRLILELKEQAARNALLIAAASAHSEVDDSAQVLPLTSPDDTSRLAVQALTTLGFKPASAEETVKKIQRANRLSNKDGKDLDVEEIVRLSLQS